MVPITIAQAGTLTAWFNPERRSLIALHAMNTGNGAFFVDRWPGPRALLVTIGTLCSLLGDPGALRVEHLKERATRLMYCSEEFLPLLQAAFPDVRGIERVVLELEGRPQFPTPTHVTCRRLEAGDADLLGGLSPEIDFISNTWGGPSGLAASGYGWGAFSGDKLVSVACTFLLGHGFEDIGVVTEPKYRGRALAAACAGLLCEDVLGRGRRATWTTSTDNEASLRVAEKLGFKFQTHEVLYFLG